MVFHHKEKCFLCMYETCNEIFITQPLLDRHIRVHHEKCFLCMYETCNKTFTTQSLLDRHIRVHHEGNDYYCCVMCLYKTGDQSVFARHIEDNHSDKPRKFQCNTCEYSTNRKNDFKKHLESKSHKIKSSFNYVPSQGINGEEKEELLESSYEGFNKKQDDQSVIVMHTQNSGGLHE